MSLFTKEQKMAFNAAIRRSYASLKCASQDLERKAKAELEYRVCVECDACLYNGEPWTNDICYRCKGKQYDAREEKRLADAPVDNDWDGVVFIDDRMWSDAESCAEDFECEGEDVPERAWCGKEVKVYYDPDDFLQRLVDKANCDNEDARAYIEGWVGTSGIADAIAAFNKNPPVIFVPGDKAIEVRKLFAFDEPVDAVEAPEFEAQVVPDDIGEDTNNQIHKWLDDRKDAVEEFYEDRQAEPPENDTEFE